MDTSPFDINYLYKGSLQQASIHPCCKEDNIVDYAVWQQDKLLFTITRDMNDARHWVVALKNADDDFEEGMIQQIGNAIQQHQSP